MSYNPRHARRARIKLGVISLAVLGLALSGSLAGASSASAALTTPMISNGPSGPGEAGFFVNDNGSTKIRDVQASLVVTSTMEDLNGSNTDPGGVGVELCNDNTGYAAQLGVEWDGTKDAFVAEYNYVDDPVLGTPYLAATVNSNSDTDPCVEGGLLNDGVGQTFSSFLNATPVTAPGAIHVGDTLHFEIYYDPWGHRHSLKFEVQDLTQNITRVQTVKVPAQDFYEAGIGVLTENQSLTGGAVNLISAFTGTSFNWYCNKGTPPDSILSSHWDTEEAVFINSSNQVTLTPAPLNTSGTSFEMLEGSTSA